MFIGIIVILGAIFIMKAAFAASDIITSSSYTANTMEWVKAAERQAAAARSYESARREYEEAKTANAIYDRYSGEVQAEPEHLSTFFKNCHSMESMAERYYRLKELYRGNAYAESRIQKDYELTTKKYRKGGGY